MKVYIEYVIIDNFIIDFLILWSTLKTLGIKINKYLIITSTLFGTVVACFLPLLHLEGVYTAMVKIIVAILMVLMCAKFDNIKQYVYSLLLFFSYTFLMGGACYAVIILIGGTFENVNIAQYNAIVPVSIIIAICFFYAFIIFRFTKYIYRKKDMMPFIGEAEIEIGGKIYKFKTFLDSGNRLYDKKTGAPVIILSAYSLEKHIDADNMAKLIFGEKSDLFNDVHYLSYTTVSGEPKKMVVFTPQKITIYTNDKVSSYQNICVGVTFKKFNDAINFDCLLHPSLI